ncbi:MAG: amidohydrolase family protein [Candidatus Cloacimonetes bacterium]|nr:amidohydrolase family protein [Candidatus Cloacimonadota bacterium]
MKITPTLAVFDSYNVHSRTELSLQINGFKSELKLSESNTIAYMPLINSHDHLVGNWYPRAADHRPYLNSHIWVEDMKDAAPYKERDIFWLNKGFHDLTLDNGFKMAQMGAYKNLFSGCAVVQDHIPTQSNKYYDGMPIEVIRHYGQYHSMTLGNWWGGMSAEEELQQSSGRYPFIMHLGEGLDENTRDEFRQAMERGLIRENTILIHGISLVKHELDEIVQHDATICWCPFSNDFLIGKSMDIDYAIKAGVNIIIGTDSSMSGSINMFEELAFIRTHYPHIPMNRIYDMVTVKAAQALHLNIDWRLSEQTPHILLTDMSADDPFENLALLKPENIKLMIYHGKPLYGDAKFFEIIGLSKSNYSIVSTKAGEKFVIGNPLALNHEIDSYLGYHKDFPYLPF